MDIRDAAKITILKETDRGGTVLKTERGHIVVALDECDGIYLPYEKLKQYNEEKNCGEKNAEITHK